VLSPKPFRDFWRDQIAEDGPKSVTNSRWYGLMMTARERGRAVIAGQRSGLLRWTGFGRAGNQQACLPRLAVSADVKPGETGSLVFLFPNGTKYSHAGVPVRQPPQSPRGPCWRVEANPPSSPLLA
jgi:hypothetical protein